MAEITIAGAVFSAPVPFAAGHVLTETEAGVLNQTYHENLRNNFAKKVKDTRGEAEGLTEQQHTDLQAAFDEYARNYEFGVRIGGGGGAARLDPIEAEARKIAREAIQGKLRDAGKKVKDIDKDQLENAIASLAQRDDIVKLATKRVKERSAFVKGAGDLLDELGLQSAA